MNQSTQDQQKGQQLDLFLFLGEKSGDLLAETLLQAIDLQTVRVAAIAGPRLRALPIKHFIDMEKFNVMGVQDVLLSLPRLLYLFYRVGAGLEACTSSLDAHALYPGRWRRAGFGDEHAREIATAHASSTRETGHGEIRLEILADPRAQSANGLLSHG